MALPAGWYPVAGDPAGTLRYWDGSGFVTGPERDGTRPGRSHGFNPATAKSKWGLAGPLSRLTAAFIDVFAPLAILYGLGVATGYGVPGPEAGRWAAETNLLTALAVWLFVNHVILVGLAGMTLGKILLGLRVVDARTRTRAPGLARALVRSLALIPGVLVTIAYFAYGRREGFHDVVAGTAVVYV
jgi:uncharacterized RDD family membrane protein YckC